MSEPLAETEIVSRPPCPFCGAPAPQWVATCVQCGREVSPATDTRKGKHFLEIVIAIAFFAGTNFVLLTSMDSRTPVSFQTMALRLFWDDRWWPHLVRGFMLGPPFLAVLWTWYQLMHEPDPDYGRLWGVYLMAQGATLIAFVVLCVAAGLIVILVTIFLLLTAAGQ